MYQIKLQAHYRFDIFLREAERFESGQWKRDIGSLRCNHKNGESDKITMDLKSNFVQEIIDNLSEFKY
jgi:hypothetical protein